jgi:hypothetical protein
VKTNLPSAAKGSDKGKRLATNKDPVTGSAFASLPPLAPSRRNLHEDVELCTGFNDDNLGSSGLRRSNRNRKMKALD